MVDSKKMQLVVGNKVWGEFDSYHKRKNRLYVDGYCGYHGVHTIRVVEDPEFTDDDWAFIGVALFHLINSRPKEYEDKMAVFEKVKNIIDENRRIELEKEKSNG